MRHFITHNQSEEKMLMNGEQCTVVSLGSNAICVRLKSSGEIRSLPLVARWQHWRQRTPAEGSFHSAWLRKHSLEKPRQHALLCYVLLDRGFFNEGLGYVACSHVKNRSQLRFVGRPLVFHINARRNDRGPHDVNDGVLVLPPRRLQVEQVRSKKTFSSLTHARLVVAEASVPGLGKPRGALPKPT